jgi:bifunctional non-homologous end joining protein LigD
MVRRDGSRVRCFTRGGHDWADRFPAIVDGCAAHQGAIFPGSTARRWSPATDGTPDFHALRSRRRGHEAILFAFDLIEHDGDDLRDLPLIERKRRLARLLGRALVAMRQQLEWDVNLFFCRCIHRHASATVRLTAWWSGQGT